MNIKTIASKLKINQYNSVFIVLFLLCLSAWIYRPSFMSGDTIFNMLRQASSLGVLTAGQLFVIMSGGVDFSVVATMQMAIVIFTYGFNLFGVWGLVVGIILSLLLGIMMGIINGVIVTKFNVQPFLATIFTGSILTGVRMIVAGIDSVGTIPDPLVVHLCQVEEEALQELYVGCLF